MRQKSDLSTRKSAQVADISHELARMILKENLILKLFKL